MAMTPKRLRFVDEYLRDLNPRAAAERAGYAAAVGYNLLYKPEVAEAIRQAQAERARRTGLSVDQVVRELAAIAFADVRNVVSWTTPEDMGEEARCRVRVKDSARVDEATAAAIREVRRYSNGAVRVKLQDKLPALALLGRHLGMFVDRAEALERQEDLARREMVDDFAQLSSAQRQAIRVAVRSIVGGEARGPDDGPPATRLSP